MKTCKNCTTRYSNKFNFCPHCGAQWLDYRLTPRKITTEFTERYLGTENVFIKTCITLFKYPEDVINGYITGQRKKYVNVINFFFISLTLFGIHIFVLKNFYPELLGFDNISSNEKNAQEYLSYLYDYMGLLTSIFIPFYALTGWVTFYKRSYNFVEHLVLFGYVFGLINLVTVLLTPVIIMTSMNYFQMSSILSVFSFILIGWYYKRIFKLSFWKTVWKTILMTFLYFIVQSVITLIIGIIVIAGIVIFYPDLLEGININLNGTQL
ncbi:DUF3667 domain-containing protein [Nonlabens arenilitoris]|uniref:DUF3667 domain-containing protein n=1 Tax=Nonlabens arenilitoris TaxID=1217969 RepID=UPI000CF4A793|nr:DUF3667 domain-containing protein [Nonlabens arenilitoris]